jgi:hypothetical protein
MAFKLASAFSIQAIDIKRVITVNELSLPTLGFRHSLIFPLFHQAESRDRLLSQHFEHGLYG